MFKTIFSKLFSTCLFIFLLTFIIMGTLLYSLLGDYVTSEKEEVLIYTGERISEITNVYIENTNPIVERIYRMNIESYGNNTQSLIFVTNVNGEILFTSNRYYRSLEGNKINDELYKDLVSGKSNSIKRIGNFGGLFNETVLTVGVTIQYNNQVVGAVFLNAPIPEINKMRFDVFKLFIIPALVALITAFILIYFLSRKISQPLKMINKAAKTISSGQFKNRVSVDSQDEVGELATTFNNMAESLENLEDMRSSFIANVSHELRTPMTTIQGFIQGIIDETIPADKQKQYLDIVLDEVKRLSRLVNDLLDLSKIESGEMELSIREFDLNELIRIVIIKFESRITQKNLHIHAQFENEHCMVVGDIDGIQRVITNLLDNAIKFSEEDGIIDISVASDNNTVFVSIEDHGIGIEEQELKYIWDRFYKTDKSRSKDKIGTGLGLAIVKQIINQHGQEINVESTADEFTRFTFTLQKA